MNENEKNSAEEIIKETEATTEKPEKKSKKKHSQREMELEQQLEEKNDRLLRLAAEYDNFRKRSQKEKEELYSSSKVLVLKELLPVLDNFERAAENKNSTLKDYQKGIEMTFEQFVQAFKKLGVESYGAEGEDFDPNYHDAVMHIEDESKGENKIAAVFSKGYKMGETVIRPATVQVVN